MRMARDMYDQLVPPDYFSEPSAAGDDKDSLAYQLSTAHDPAYREFPATAIVMVNFYIQQNGFDFDAIHLRTLLHSQLEQYDEMAKDAERLIQLRPQEPVGHVWRGLSRLLSGDMVGTLESVEAANKSGVGMNHELAKWCNTIRGLAFVSLGRPTDAIAFLDTALGQDNRFFCGILARAYASDVVGDLPVAIAFLSRAVSLEPDNVDCIVARGKRLSEMGDYRAARNDYETAVRMVGPSATLAVLLTETMSRGFERRPAAPRDVESGKRSGTAQPSEGLRRSGEPEPVDDQPVDSTSFQQRSVVPAIPPGQTSAAPMNPGHVRRLLFNR